MIERTRRRPIRIRLGGPEQAVHGQSFLGGKLEVSSARGVKGAERTLIESLDQDLSGRVLVAGSREGVVALALALLFHDAEVHLLFFDAYELHRARETLDRNGACGVRTALAANFPQDGSYDWVALPVARAAEAMLTGELLRQTFRALKPRGKVLAASDNPHDRWLHRQVLEVFGAATIHRRGREGVAYIARKRPGSSVRERRYRREFRARLFGQELQLETRPGVFSHGELDEGTLALAEAASPGPAARVLDLGCGSGALGVAAALAAPAGRALLCDSSARAAAVARGNVERNGAWRNALVVITHDLEAVRRESFDLALANPPYYGDHRITEEFVRAARRLLVPGGELLLVTRAPERPGELIARHFGGFEPAERRGYTILRAKTRDSALVSRDR